MIVNETIDFLGTSVRYCIEVPEIDAQTLTRHVEDLFGPEPDSIAKVAYLSECCTIHELSFGDGKTPAHFQFKHVLRSLERVVHLAIAKMYPWLVDDDGKMPWVKFSHGYSTDFRLPPVSTLVVH